MLPIFFIISLLIAAGLLVFGYIHKAKEAILIGGIILILLGVSAAVNNVDYASGTNTIIFTENEYLPYNYTQIMNETEVCINESYSDYCNYTAYLYTTEFLFMNSTTTETETITYSQTTGIINKILGVILALIGLYFIIAAVILI